jgi:hypothetical protein
MTNDVSAALFTVLGHRFVAYSFGGAASQASGASAKDRASNDIGADILSLLIVRVCLIATTQVKRPPVRHIYCRRPAVISIAEHLQVTHLSTARTSV